MFGLQNPYGEAVRALEDAISACYRALGELEGIPQGKGKGDIEHATDQAKNLLYEALIRARQWRDSFAYHLDGGYGYPRSDF